MTAVSPRTWPIAELVPHAGDMILIDEVLAFDEDSIRTRLRIRPDSLFSAPDGSLPAWAGVELMAQSIAAFAGCHARSRGEPVRLGFLLGTRKFECNVASFPPGCDMTVTAERSLQDDNGMGVFECHLTAPGVEATARLNVYSPPQPDAYLTGEAGA